MGSVHERALLLTDIEGSTVLWEREGSMGTAVARHETLVTNAVSEAGGILVKHKGEGDSTFSVFDDAAAALDAAVALQMAMAVEPWSTTTPIRVRIGVDTGPIEERDGDFYGRTANRAARVRGLGAGGTIVLTAATADRVGDALPEGARLVDLGDHALRGVEGVVGLLAVAHPDLADPETALAHLPFRAAAPVPSGLRFASHAPIVGRERELRALTGAWVEAIRGRSTVALVSGEPGIGKTRLLAALAERAASDGALILHGRCDEEGFRPYQPFAEAIADAITRLSADELLRVVGSNAADVAVIVPELRSRIRFDEPATSERFVVFEAVARSLMELASERPLILIAEDLHWADEPTLALFRHLARRLADRPVLVVAGYRSTDADQRDGFVQTLVAVRREAAALDVPVEGLSLDEVATLLGPDHADHLDQVWAASDGNPFLVVELRRSLEAGRAGVPTTVRQSVGHRVDGLPMSTRRLVAVAAVAGEIEAEVLALADPVGADAAQPAIDNGLLEPATGTPGRLRFVHALIRDAVLERLAAAERRDLHLRVAAAIEERHQPDLEPHAARLAHHHRLSGDASAGGQAYEWSMRAGRQAGGSLAYEEAEREFRAALDIACAAGDRAGKVVAELNLAEVLGRGGRPTAGYRVATQAEAAATAMGAEELRAWAVFTTRFGQALGQTGNLDVTRAVLDTLGSDSPWRVPLEVQMAGELIQDGDVDAGICLLDAAVERGRAFADPVMIGLALTGRHLYVDRLDTPVESILAALAPAQDALAPSFRLAPSVLRVQTESLRVGELVASGHVAAARQAADAFETRYGGESGTIEANVPLFRLTDALLRGDWDTRSRLLDQLREDPERAGAYGSQLLGCEMMSVWLRGRFGDLTAAIEGLPASMMLARPGLALAHADSGREASARAVIAECAIGGGFEARARTVVGRSELALLSYAAAMAGDQEHAARLLPLLEPRCGQIAAWAGWGFWGAFDQLVGILAATCGRHDDAVRHLRAALALHDRSGWRVFSAFTAAELAAVLTRRGGHGDAEEAAGLTARTCPVAEALGLVPVLRRLST